MIQVINPATGELIRSYTEMSEKEVQKIIEDAQNVYQDWKRVGFKERTVLMKTFFAILKQEAALAADLMAQEMRKPIRQGRAEAEKCSRVCSYNAERFLQPEQIETGGGKSSVVFMPLGIILGVMPWNFPFWQVFRFAAALKHSSIVPGCGLRVEAIFKKA